MHDLVIANGTLHDGLGSPGRIASVAINGETVTELSGDVGPARRTIDAEGLVVAPGFIDPHTHSDLVPMLGDAQPFKLMQGVTTEIVGNCGFSFAPMTVESAALMAPSVGGMTCGLPIEAGTFAELLDRLEASAPTNNVGVLVGHNTLRLLANGQDSALRPGALDAMIAEANRAFEAGAVGLSTGLIYTPGTYADTDEVVELAKVARRWARPYTTHLRDESRSLLTALDEAIEIGRRAQVAVQISHCKAAGRASHGASNALLERLRQARVSGIDIRGDQYPYTAGSTVLSALFPSRALELGSAALAERLADPSYREQLLSIAEDQHAPSGTGLWREVTPDAVLVMAHRNESVIGQTLATLADRMGTTAWQALCTIFVDDPAAMMATEIMDDGDVRNIMADPLIAIGSDSEMPVGLHHPRTWGCQPRFLGKFVRDESVVPLEEAIRKLTSAGAGPFDIGPRGWLGPGAVADVCVFDLATIGHAGDFIDPDVAPSGMTTVVLGGRVVVDGGTFTGERHGHVLRARGV